MNKDRRLIINMIASMMTLLLNLSISFFLAQYIVNNIGGQAYGFVNLANAMANYAIIITVALNSVAGRFITLSYHRGNKEEANKYFNSVLYANMILSLVFLLVGGYVVLNIENIINIPAELLLSVKQLYALIFLNYILSIVSTVFTVATFITNKLYISSIINAISYGLRALLFYLFFSFLPATVAYVGVVSVICTTFMLVANMIFTRKLIPDIKISRKYFSVSKVKTLLSAGIWSSVSSLSWTLSDGLDLLISNLFISSLAMGQLSIAKTLGNILNMVMANISNLFAPQMTYYYAQKDIKNLLSELKLNMLITAAFANIPFCFLWAFGKDLIMLWVPTQDANMVYTLMLLTIFSFFTSPVINGLYSVFLITNNLKGNAIYWLCISIFDTVVVLTLLKFTHLGIFVVAGVSTLMGSLSNLTFVPIFASRCLEQKWNIFYPVIMRYVAVTLALAAALSGIHHYFPANGWLKLMMMVAVSGIIGLAFDYLLLFGSSERSKLQSMIRDKLFNRQKSQLEN
jgi:O-antigen/teichoic acid export membrane protein